MTTPWLPSAPWLPVTAPLTSGSNLRTPELLERVVAQFDLDRAERWQRRTEQERQANGVTIPVVRTYCNIWLNDVTAALGCEVPRFWQFGSALKPLSANMQVDWLRQHGAAHGWRQCEVTEAQARANLGYPAVATWHSRSLTSGHVALFVPSRGEEGLWVSQAGLTCFSRGSLSSGFGARSVTCFTHP